MSRDEIYEQCHECVVTLSNLARRRGDLVGANHWQDYLEVLATLHRHGRSPRPAVLTRLGRAVAFARSITNYQSVA